MSYAFYNNEYPGVQFEIPVRLFNPLTKKSVTLKSVIDTASWSVFDYSHAEELGIDVTKGYSYFEGAGGNISYLHRIQLQIGNLRPVTADVYFGSLKSTYPWIKTHDLGHIGWANNGGLLDYIMDYDVNSTITFTDFSLINSLPRPNNPYTILKLSPPRVDQKMKDILLYNNRPYVDIIIYNKRTGEPVKMKIAIDTGSTFTLIKEKFAHQLLGTNDITFGGEEILTVKNTVRFYQHKLMVKIGDLKPTPMKIGFVGPNDIVDYDGFSDALLGNDNMSKFKLRFMRDRVMFEENPYPLSVV